MVVSEGQLEHSGRPHHVPVRGRLHAAPGSVLRLPTMSRFSPHRPCAGPHVVLPASLAYILGASAAWSKTRHDSEHGEVFWATTSFHDVNRCHGLSVQANHVCN